MIAPRRTASVNVLFAIPNLRRHSAMLCPWS
jgi:hypothetical protein